MGALTGNAIKDTYLDVVQLGKSGAGLPSHAGKEAALYDGSGAQILGRTAVRSYFDPDPDAISASSWEFSTYGNATQAALEAAGWSFTNYTASVVNGALVTYKTAAYDTLAKAELTVSLNGNFDYILIGGTAGIDSIGSNGGYATSFGMYLADSAGSAFGMCVGSTSSCSFSIRGYKSSTYANLASGTVLAENLYNVDMIRIWRASGTVYIGAGTRLSTLNGTSSNTWRQTSAADASTFNKLILVGSEVGKTTQYSKAAYYSIRRYS